MKKIMICCIVCISLLAGCSSEKKESKEVVTNTTSSLKKIDGKSDTKESTLDKKVKKVDQKELKIIDSKLENKELIEITLDVKNVGEQEDGIGAMDFHVEAEGKNYTPDVEQVSLNGAINKGKSLQGSVFFKVPDKVTKGKLVYTSSDGKTCEWDITPLLGSR